MAGQHAMASPEPVAAAVAAPVHAGETKEAAYARQTRNATTFIAVCVGIFTALALIGLIVIGAQAASIKNQLEQINNNGGTSTSNCESQGGTNPNC